MVRGRTASGVLAVVVAVLPATPAAADVAWPDGLSPGTFHAATVGAASITAGKNHSCAITSLGVVQCWGDNSAGQLGDGNVPHDATTAVPVSASGDLTDAAVQVDAGDAHTCAIDVNGIASCWGAGGQGQLGTGSTADASVPAEVGALAGHTLVEITTGAQHTCAIDDDGAAWCWGDNSAGQLGVPGLSPGTDVPVRVSTTSGMTDPVVDIAAGGDTTCAATEDGVAYCWGAGGAGQLGDGASADRDRPVAVSMAGPLGGEEVRQVTVGDAQACAVDAHGDASCWGDTAPGGSVVPAAVHASGVRFGQLAAGARHVCGLARDATAYCWGSDVNGQLGDGSTTHVDDPARIATGARDPAGRLRDIEAGARHSCALDGRGVAYCWGADDEGQLGDGGHAARTVPVLVRGLPRPPAGVRGVRVAALDGGLRVTWRPPGDFGSGAFVAYLAVTTDYASSCEVTVAAGAGCDLRGLVNGRTYEVAVLTYATDGVALGVLRNGAPRGRPAALPPSLAPGSGGGLPVTGDSPLLLAALGCLLVGLGLAAMLVRRPS